MSDARKCSWTEAPSGLSPVEKYRYVYENARKVAQIRAATEHKEQKKVYLFNLFRQISSQKPINTTNIAETVESSWTVIPYNEQVGEFKALVMESLRKDCPAHSLS